MQYQYQTGLFETRVYDQAIKHRNLEKNLVEKDVLLGVDIGGTNSNFGLFENRAGTLVLVASLHLKSQQVTDYAPVFTDLLAHIKNLFGFRVTAICLGVAGVVSVEGDSVRPTHLPVTISIETLKVATGIATIFCINDFEACALGIDQIIPQSIVSINDGVPRQHGQRGCIGAGTGMGKAALVWDMAARCYRSVASEGGHTDAVAYDEQEQLLFAAIKKVRGGTHPLSWEDLLSGRGIGYIYQCLSSFTLTSSNLFTETDVSALIAREGFKPDLISAYAQHDQRCLETFKIYTKMYARCAKNYALETLALGGLYIGGGIAAKNVALFQAPEFMQEFVNSHEHSDLLKNIPLFVIADYNISLYGAARAIILRERGLI